MKRYKRTGRQPKMPSEKKKGMTSKMWISIGIAVIMASSIVGFMTLGNTASPSGPIEYNDYTFLDSQNGWVVNVGETERTFEYLPFDVEQIPYPSDMSSWIREALVITMTSDPDDNLSSAIGAVEYAFFTQFSEQGKIVIYSFVENNTFDKPIMTCANATLYQPVILFQAGDTTEITNEGYCVIATADTDDNMRRLGERILYTYYQIIPDDVSVGNTTVAVSAPPSSPPPSNHTPMS